MTIKTAEYRHGVISYFDTDPFIGRAIETYGEREELEVELLTSLVKEGDVVVDVGAHIGTDVIPLAKEVGPHGQVFAFEPQAPVCAILSKNAEQNHLDNVQTFNVALGSGTGTASLPPINYEEVRNFGGIALEQGDEVPVASLDQFITLTRCDLMKIDVEGMERQVLEGARETIARCRPVIYVENDREDKSAALIQMIKSLGYEMWWHTPPLFNQRNWKGERRDDFPNIVSINMLCVPEGRSVPQTRNLRRIATQFDRPFGDAVIPAGIKPLNGWAGVARFGGIGDNLMAASAIGALKRKGFKVEVITSSDCAWQVFQHNPNIDKLSVKTKSEIPTGGDMLDWQKWFSGRADEFDVFAHLSHSCEGLLALFPAATQFHWPAHVRRRICNKNYLEMVHDIAGCAYDFGPLFYASSEEHEKALETKRKVGERCIAWCISGTRIDKIHPHAPGAIARIVKELNVPVVLLGREGKNFDDAKAIVEHVKRTNGSESGVHVAISSNPDENGHRAIDWPIRRTLAFAQVCDVVIGPDTGVMWAVAFEPMRKIMLLSHASAENITKHWVNTDTLTADPARVQCWPCHRLHDTPEFCTPNKENNGAACITDISVERIVAAAKEALEDQSSDSKRKTA